MTDLSVLGSGNLTPSPLASSSFEAESLKQDAGPACGSRLSVGTLLDGRLTRTYQRSTGSPSAEQPSVLGSWLDFSIHHFHSELQRLRRQTRGTFTPGFAQLHRAHQVSAFRFPVSRFMGSLLFLFELLSGHEPVGRGNAGTLARGAPCMHRCTPRTGVSALQHGAGSWEGR